MSDGLESGVKDRLFRIYRFLVIKARYSNEIGIMKPPMPQGNYCLGVVGHIRLNADNWRSPVAGACKKGYGR